MCIGQKWYKNDTISVSITVNFLYNIFTLLNYKRDKRRWTPTENGKVILYFTQKN